MTAPKQEIWVARNRYRLAVPLVGSVGAAFDYLAETKTRSPRWFREHGLEWLPRLVREPARLWRRTFLSAPLFLWYSLRESLSRRHRRVSVPPRPRLHNPVRARPASTSRSAGSRA
jgi:N-acetylglucosaminyldiphosphoundecaprenol N-acetyl-beta-D-mannosaminyltransferase